MAVRFDNSGERLQRTANLPGINSWTIMGWVKLSVDRDNYSTFFKYGPLASNFSNSYIVGTGPSGTTLVAFNGGGADVTGSELTVGTWYHVAATVSGTGAGQFRVYLNGVLDITHSGASRTGGEIVVGLDGTSGAGDWLNGCVAALKVYSAALSPEDIQAEMRSYLPVRTANLNSFAPLLRHTDVADYSGAGNNWTTNGTLSTEDGPPVAWRRGQSRIVLSSASVAAPLSVDDNPELSHDGSLTVAGWFNLPDLTSGLEVLVAKWPGEWRVYKDNDRLKCNIGGSDACSLEFSAAGAEADEWNSFVFVYDASAETIQGWINNSDGGESPTSYTGGLSDGDAPVTFGALDGGGSPLASGSKLDALGIWKRAFTAGDRAGFYNSGVGIEFPSAAEHERSASLDAQASIQVSGHQVLERSASIDASADVAVSGQKDLSRSVSVDATAEIQSAQQRELLRSSTVDATGEIVSAGQRDLLRVVSLNADAVITVAGQHELHRSVLVNADAAISVSGHSVLERSATINADATIASVPQRDLLRSAALNADASITSTGQRDLLRAVAINAQASIAVIGQIEGGISEFERSASLNADGLISVTAEFFSIIEAATSFNADAVITVAGQLDTARTVSINADAAISVSGHGVIERSVTVNASASIASVGQRDLLRSTAFNADALITVVGQIEGGINEFQRAVAIDAGASVSVTGHAILERSSSLNADATITASGIFFSTLERSSLLNADASITVSGVSFSVFDRSASLDALAGIAVSSERLIERLVSVGAEGVITTSRNVEFFRSVQINGQAVIQVVGQHVSQFGPPVIAGPARIVLTTSGESRAQTLKSEIAMVANKGGTSVILVGDGQVHG